MKIQATTYSGKPVLFPARLTGKAYWEPAGDDAESLAMIQVEVAGSGERFWVSPVDCRTDAGNPVPDSWWPVENLRDGRAEDAPPHDAATATGMYDD